MKKLLILLLLSSGVWAQTVDFDKFATKEDVRKANARVDSLNRALSGAIVIPPVGIPDCDHGPDIKNVYAITKTGLTFLFDAVGVTPIQWKVSNIGDTASVARGVVAPTSNSPTIQFGKTLTAKPYRLWIDGVICKNDKGVIPYTFSVPGSTGEVDPPVVVPPIITLLPCESGPLLKGIASITQTSMTPNFYGVGVTGIAWKIYSSTDTAAIRKGSFAPKSDREPISFESLAPGNYILQYSGTTCKGSDTRAFTIPKLTGDVTPNPPRVPADQTGKVYELILNLTGEGFESTYWDNVQKKYVENTTGIKESGYIDKFKLKDGSYTITGTRIAMPWFEFEKTPGNYEIEGVKRMIKWHRERGLSLSICFLPWRRYGDGFFGPGSFMKGNRGGTFYPVSITDDPVYNQTMASYWDEQTNAKIKEAVRVLSQVLGTYEKAGYIGLGSGRGEEYVMPNFESWILKPSPLNNGGRKIVEASDLSDQFMLKFKQWVEKRGLTPYRRPDFDSENGYLDASNEIGKEYMRFCTYTLRKYFDNFADGVREGSTKVNVCFFIPSVGAHLNANELVAYFSYIAKNADELYHSDGAFAWDNERKTNGVRVFRGTFPDKPASAEIDPQDAGYQPGWGTGEVTTEQFTGLALNIWKAGGMRVHMAMKYLDNSVARVNEGASRMRQYTGKPYSPPAVTSNNTVIIDITKDPHNVFKNNTLYDDTFKATPDTYVKQIETLDFWGGVAPDSEL